MKISEILEKKFTFSFEFFPPKTVKGEKKFLENLKELKKLNPDFVSVTYGAGGNTREKTKAIVKQTYKENHTNTMAHLTCISHSKEEILSILEYYKSLGIKNILALRGDIPKDSQVQYDKAKEEFPNTIDLIKFIKQEYGDYFSIGGAVFPEMHPESKCIEDEMKYLKKKIEAGMEFGMTQLFYENQYYYEYVERLKSGNVKIPILPGIMPITSYKQIEKFKEMCNAKIPDELVESLKIHQENPEKVEKIGIEFCINQCKDLLKYGVSGLHFYTLNKSKATLNVFEKIKEYI